MNDASAMLIDADDLLLREDGSLAAGACEVLRRMRLGSVPVLVFSDRDESLVRDHLERGLGHEVAAVTAVVGRGREREAGSGFPSPTILLQTISAHGVDPFGSWMLTRRQEGLRAAEQAGCAGVVWFGAALERKPRLTLRQADCFANCTIAMVPAEGGCWHART
ncbi:MAG: hypothetical protein ACOCXA_06210 [Planctomycetota bacterium]